MKKLLILPLVVVVLVSYCQKNIGGPTQSDIDNLLFENMVKGDTQNHIEEVLKNEKFAYIYDSNLNRYQAILENRDESCFRTFLYDCGIQIYIYLDRQGTYESHEILVLHSGL
ncbi:hypothetical protein [Aliiglaciecola litoralis]|uniref:Lipoprotein n=1 Tax=Aliiglaciecola litoralis TaxID=582857 RepID=A0ABP3X6R8_9ALTE